MSRIPSAVRAGAMSALAGLIALTSASAALAVDVSQPTLKRDSDARGDRGVFTSDASGDFTWHWRLYAEEFDAVDKWGNRFNGDIPILGDFDGDGRNDPVVYRPGSPSRWFINGSSSGPRTVSFGDSANGDVPLHGDFDGDRKADIAVARPAPRDDGPWTWFVAGSTGGQQELQWGDSRTDVPVPANYVGDGRTDVAVRRFEVDGTTAWYVRSDNGTLSRVGWGNHSDATVTGDYDGDGRTDITVVRATPENTLR